MKHLIKPVAILTISNVLTRVFAIIFFIILARSLSVDNYGLFRYLLSISLVYAIVFSGFPTALTKFISEKKRSINEYISNTLFLMISAFIIISLIILLFHQRNEIYLILLIFASLVDSFYLGFVRGLLNYVKLSGFKFVENLIQLIILIISYLIYNNINFAFAIIFYTFSGIITLLIFELNKSEIILSLKISKEKIIKILKYTVPVTLGAIGWAIMFGINAIFINLFYGSAHVGYYSVGETIAQVFTFVPAAIVTILLPKVSTLKDKKRILKPLLLANLSILFTSILILIALIFFKDLIIKIIFTEKYILASSVIMPLAIGQIAISIHNIYASIFQGIGKPGIPSITISIACVLNLIGSYFLTKNYGIFGAALSNAITSCVALILIVFVFNNMRKKWKTH
jgi:stage V sporulation protein B